jgi:membrane protease YdiL (CAAX protease family)
MTPTRTILVIAAAITGLVAYDLAFGAVTAIRHWRLDEIALYAWDKGGFALALALVVTGLGAWRRLGFAGGLRPGAFWLLWPIWADAALAGLQGVANPDPTRLLGWVLIAMAVAFGEEVIFRGFVMNALGGTGPRRAVIVSALLFGAVHLIGLLANFDARIIVSQALFAGGIGLALGCVRLMAGSIWPCLIAHAALDALGLITTDGIGAAMRFSPDEVWFMLISAAVALLWGLYLLSRISRRGGEANR